MDVHRQLSDRLRQLRAAQGLSLETLAERSGVSRSNISLIERGESSPSAVVLDRLATALGLTLAELFAGGGGDARATPPAALSRAAGQAVWTDPASGYRRRALSPEGARELQLAAVEFPPGQRVAYETGARSRAVEQQIWVMAGRIAVTAGDQSWTLQAGDCLVMRLDAPVVFHNPDSAPARYLVALATPAAAARAAGPAAASTGARAARRSRGEPAP